MLKILYHANCTDGYGAALAAWTFFGDNDVEYIPVQYGTEPPEIGVNDVVYIVDFSYSYEQICEMAIKAKNIYILDHHKTAQEALSGIFPQKYNNKPLGEIYIEFDMNRSGAVITWEYLFKTKAPTLFQHIQDRDLWKFELEGTRDIIKGLDIYPDWRDWTPFIKDPSNLIQQGKAINTFLDNEASKIIKSPPRLWDMENIVIPFYNLQGFMISDTLHQALEKYPECPYAVAYFDLSDRRIFSLRSRSGTDVDVSEIAKKYGGGGHKHAAGFYVHLV